MPEIKGTWINPETGVEEPVVMRVDQATYGLFMEDIVKHFSISGSNEPSVVEGDVVERMYTTVGELVEQLQKLDQSLPVATNDREDGLAYNIEANVQKLDESDNGVRYGPCKGVFEPGQDVVIIAERW